jgi:hypothetical protein
LCNVDTSYSVIYKSNRTLQWHGEVLTELTFNDLTGQDNEHQAFATVEAAASALGLRRFLMAMETATLNEGILHSNLFSVSKDVCLQLC